MFKKEDFAVVLDFLPHGKAGEAKQEPVVQCVGELFFNPSFLAGRISALRFNHKIGVVRAKRGAASFEVEFMDGHKKKMLIVTNVHLKAV